MPAAGQRQEGRDSNLCVTEGSGLPVGAPVHGKMSKCFVEMDASSAFLDLRPPCVLLPIIMGSLLPLRLYKHPSPTFQKKSPLSTHSKSQKRCADLGCKTHPGTRDTI